MTDVAANLARVRAELDAACREAGRDPASVGLVAVGKRHGIDRLQAALDAGQIDLGENYAQELRDKAAAITAPVRWHFIGRVQSNKARYVAPVAWRVHALEEVHHAEALVARAPAGIDALVAVHTGDEQSKGGVAPSQVVARVRELVQVPGLRVRGLMTLPPHTDDPEDAAPFFAEVADLLQRLRADGHEVDELSMGMSHDFRVAVRHGATWVRIGTAIFGERPTA
ncbi:MAG: YggS family pyridoxal phosphate-dependent enzyme [Alphaproteobacteria bacterium]|nr:YggS family pyridoxal phosphate-dependent enzyme [Alphaproteobacteria bacterium]